MPDRVTLLMFSPGDAERITGLSNDQQRNWRRRGFLKSHEGYARFDVFELADMWTLKMLSDRGIGPAEGRQALDVVSPRLAWHALAEREAWEGGTDQAPGENWPDKSRWLRREVMSLVPARFAVWLADGRIAYATSLDDLFDRFAIDDSAAGGPMVLFDLQNLGSLLLQRARRPLAHFDNDPPE